MVRAENQALVADLKAVPRAERHRLKEINTEEAYADWRLRLAAEPLFAARDRYEAACAAGWQDIPDDWAAEISEESEEFARTKTELEEAEAVWTTACLDWYELFLSLER
jgi:ATP-binding cassette subfamily F protein 3